MVQASAANLGPLGQRMVPALVLAQALAQVPGLEQVPAWVPHCDDSGCLVVVRLVVVAFLPTNFCRVWTCVVDRHQILVHKHLGCALEPPVHQGLAPSQRSLFYHTYCGPRWPFLVHCNPLSVSCGPWEACSHSSCCPCDYQSLNRC